MLDYWSVYRKANREDSTFRLLDKVELLGRVVCLLNLLRLQLIFHRFRSKLSNRPVCTDECRNRLLITSRRDSIVVTKVCMAAIRVGIADPKDLIRVRNQLRKTLEIITIGLK